MNPDHILGRVVSALDGAGIPYMLTGSFASSFHGVPRASQDIDTVVDPTERQLTVLVNAFPASDYYVEFERRVKAELHGQALYVTSAEDIVLVKLEWDRARQLAGLES